MCGDWGAHPSGDRCWLCPLGPVAPTSSSCLWTNRSAPSGTGVLVQRVSVAEGAGLGLWVRMELGQAGSLSVSMLALWRPQGTLLGWPWAFWQLALVP